MNIFTLTKEQEQTFENFKSQTSKMIEKLQSGNEEQDIKDLHNLLERFSKKVDDFFHSERRLNIGIVGQVKSGKSSFLNTLLFEGKFVLPKASTPKTATLTKIEYAEENAMEIEYYNEEDWEVIVDNAKQDREGEVYESARELVRMARGSGVDIATKLKIGKERVTFSDYEELMNRINEYVGENGKYTALVKAVVLYVNNPLFRQLSIVDTPGLNDPIVSRTLRTKEFMEVCDVVFFLSPCSAFLDKSDWTLLSTQLPQKGVKRLILVGSKFDSGLRDVLRHTDPDDPFGKDPNTADNIPEAITLVRDKLTTRTQMKIKEFEKQLRQREADESLIKVLENCRKPVFVSGMVQNMVGRDKNEYDAEENNVYHALSEFSTNLDKEFLKIGNFEAVKGIQQEVIEEKETILEEKSSGFIPMAQEELIELLFNFKEKAKRRLTLLSGNDRQKIIEMKDEIQKQMNAIRADVRTVIGEWLVKIEKEKSKGIQELRKAAEENRKLEERTGTETKRESYTVSDSTWYKPWTWGSKHTEYYTYDESYSYIVTSDAIDNIRNFISASESQIEKSFLDAVNHQQMKRRLLEVVASNFDMGDERYDASLFRLMVEEQINKLEFPVIKVDIGKTVDTIASTFEGEVRSSNNQSALRNALSNAIDTAISALMNEFEQATNQFKQSLSNIGDGLQEAFLSDVHAEFEKILKDLDEKDANIARLSAYVNQLDRAVEEVRG